MTGIFRIALAGILSAVMIGKAAATTAAGAWTARLVPTARENIAYLSGRLQAGSFRIFQEVVSSADPDIIVLDRTWGSLDEALLIAKDIDHRHLNTFLYSRANCVLHCALLFLSGKTKYLFEGARIGVSASVFSNGRSEFKASILAHLIEIGVPPEIIARIKALPPSAVLWLTPEDHNALGVVTLTPPHRQARIGAPDRRQEVEGAAVDNRRNCGAGRARYEGNNGAAIWVLRTGLTKAFYVPSNALPGLVLEIIGRTGKAGLVHGPALSFMFLSPDGIPTEITWRPGNDHMPEFFRIMSDDGLTPLYVFYFATCENAP